MIHSSCRHSCYTSHHFRPCNFYNQCFHIGCNTGGDVVFVLDNSGSIGKKNFNTMVGFVKAVVGLLDIDRGDQDNVGTR